MKTATRKTMTCPKCDGKKYFECFGHVAQGVCFRCAGAGVVPYRKAKPMAPASEYVIKWAERIIAMTEEELEGMAYNHLLFLRDFAHHHIPQYPDLLAVWKAKGDKHFFAAQDERLQAMGY